MVLKKLYKCDQCNFSTKYNYNLKPHKKAKHDGKQDISCDKCEYKSPNKKYFYIHQKTAHNNDNSLREDGGERPMFQCGRCSFSTKYSWNLKMHLQSVHEGIKSKHCTQCSFKTSYTKKKLLLQLA